MTSREQFEAALLQVLRENHPAENVQMGEIVAHRRGEGYESSLFAMAWWAWQTSRDNVEVRLPAPDESYDNHGHLLSRDSVIAALEEQGLKVAP